MNIILCLSQKNISLIIVMNVVENHVFVTQFNERKSIVLFTNSQSNND